MNLFTKFYKVTGIVGEQEHLLGISPLILKVKLKVLLSDLQNLQNYTISS